MRKTPAMKMTHVPLDSVDGSGGRVVYKMVGDVRELVAATYRY